ncbi:hypothetical protein DL770_009510 [Monosporascus sp. CRB-9-2]|nr:hypothetical protein DL770_009510 [Monosporascus sp. CRB-9-2]
MDPGPPHKRRRPAVACTECRRRKISCDLACPCGPCSKSRSGLKCVYNNNGTSTSTNSADLPSSKPDDLPKTVECSSDQRTRPDAMAPLSHYVSLLGPAMSNENMLDLESISLDTATSHIDANENLFDLILDFSNRPGFDPKLMPMNSWGLTSSSVSPALTNMSFSSLTANGQIDMGTQSSLPPSTSSNSVTLPERVSNIESGTNEFDTQSYKVLVRAEGVQSLLRGVAGCTSDGKFPLQSGSESVQSLMGTLTKLERAAREESENKAALNRGPPTNAVLAANAAWDLLPARSQCDVLLDAYFKSFESVLRILHVPSFLQEYDRFWSRSRSQWNCADEIFVCSLLVAMALGCCVSLNPYVLNDSGRAVQEQAVGWIAYSRDFLARKMVKDAHSDFETAQLMCLLTLARHTQAQRGDSASAKFMFGDYDLARIGIQLRLYREPGTRCAQRSTKEVEMRRRLWATMLELSLQSCFDEGLPVPIAPDGYDCEPPSNIADEDIEGGFGQQGFTPSTILVLLAKTQRLRLRILHLVNSPGTPKTSEETCRIAAELNEACNANMNILNTMKPSEPTEFQSKLLEMFTRPFLLALHNSFPEKEFTKQAAYYSRRMRMEVSMLLLAPASPFQGPEPLESPSLLGIPAFGPAVGTANQAITAFNTTSNNTTGAASTPPPATVDAYASLLVHSNGHGHFVRIQRQMIAWLCLDLISELEKNEFPTLNRPSLQQLRGVLRVAMRTFESRMRCSAGAHSAREFVVFAAAAAYIDALLLSGGEQKGQAGRQQEVDETIARAVLEALNAFTEVLHRAKL